MTRLTKERLQDMERSAMMADLMPSETVLELLGEIETLREQKRVMKETLKLVAAPKRYDGTYNRCREACEKLARETLSAILRRRYDR